MLLSASCITISFYNLRAIAKHSDPRSALSVTLEGCVSVGIMALAESQSGPSVARYGWQ